jgi:hypothetical protein
MTKNFFYYLLAFNLAAGFLLVQVEIQRRAASAWMVNKEGMNFGDFLVQESIGLLWLIPGVIAILILTRWFHGRPVFTDRGEERNMTRHDSRNPA